MSVQTVKACCSSDIITIFFVAGKSPSRPPKARFRYEIHSHIRKNPYFIKKAEDKKSPNENMPEAGDFLTYCIQWLL